MITKSKKIKAFTLSEMIIAIVITLIVVGLAFAVLQLVQKQMWGMQKGYEKNTELNLAKQILWQDFSTFSSIIYDGSSDILYCKNEIKETAYFFDRNYLIRGQDTISIEIIEKKMFFDGKEQTSGEVDAIQLITGKNQGDKKIFVYKHNTAETYLKN